MAPSEGVWIAWSGGKDSALTLLWLQRQGVPIAGLMSTVVGSPPVVPFHGTSVRTLRHQAQALGLPLRTLHFRHPPSDTLYAHRFRALVRRLRCRALAFGDIFLEDVRRYRETLLEGLPIELHFPLWQHETAELVEAILQSGIRAIITGVDGRCLSPEWLGHPYDRVFLQTLPPGVDPCGERGEFHTCLLSMPGFSFQVTLQHRACLRWADHWYTLLFRSRRCRAGAHTS